MRTKLRLTYLMLLGGLICFIPVSILAQEDFIDKHVKEFTVGQDAKLTLENKYGDIDIRDWNKDVIKVEVEIKLIDISKQKADQIFEKVNINFSESGNHISVVTDYEDEFFKLVGRTNQQKERKFEVNFVVMLPSSTSVDVHNKYGSIFVNKLSSASNIDLKYGTLKINQLLAKGKDGMTNINLAYSKGNIENCQWIKLSSKYSSLTIQECKAIIAISKYSKLYIDKGSSLVCESKYDTYHMGTFTNFVSEAKYSNFRFDEIRSKISLETSYTDTKVGYVPAGFELIDIDNSYGSINIEIDPEASYRLDGEAKYAKIHYPDVNSKVSRFQDNNEQRLEGIVGIESSDIGKVKIETRYGEIRLY